MTHFTAELTRRSLRTIFLALASAAACGDKASPTTSDTTGTGDTGAGTVGVSTSDTGEVPTGAGSTSTGDNAVCDAAGTPSQCAACCEQAHPMGLEKYQAVIGDCVCNGCSDSCRESVCVQTQTPSDECLPCVQASLAGDTCQHHAGFYMATCLGDPDCAALVSCLVSC